MIQLDGHKLSTWQRGRRRYAIESQYRFLPWHPITLFSTVMRRAIFHLSSGLDRHRATTDAINTFMACAKQPGLDVRYGDDTYTLAMDLCATMRVILAYLERITLTVLYEIEPITLVHPNIPDTDVRWSFLAHADESGVLHRWVFVDHIDADVVLKELHKWETIGDIIVHDAPMMIHFLAIGHTINGRRYSPWCRAYTSPLIAGQIRFAKKKGKLTENWTPIFFADNPKNNPDHWLDQMIEDDAHEALVLHKTVAQPSKRHVDDFYRDVRYEAKQIQSIQSALRKPLDLPMCRTSCDVPYVCPHQLICYSATATFENSGLYERQDRGLATPAPQPA